MKKMVLSFIMVAAGMFSCLQGMQGNVYVANNIVSVPNAIVGHDTKAIDGFFRVFYDNWAIDVFPCSDLLTYVGVRKVVKNGKTVRQLIVKDKNGKRWKIDSVQDRLFAKKKIFYGVVLNSELEGCKRFSCEKTWTENGQIKYLVQGPDGKIGFVLQGDEDFESGITLVRKILPGSIIYKDKDGTVEISYRSAFDKKERIIIPASNVIIRHGSGYIFDEKTRMTCFGPSLKSAAMLIGSIKEDNKELLPN